MYTCKYILGEETNDSGIVIANIMPKVRVPQPSYTSFIILSVLIVNIQSLNGPFPYFRFINMNYLIIGFILTLFKDLSK